MSSKVWLIVGGGGFIGTNLVNHLRTSCPNVGEIMVYDYQFNEKHTDNNIRYLDANLVSLEHVLTHHNIKISYIVNLASNVGVNNVKDNPHDTITAGLEVALTLNKHCMVPMFFASTSEVYGNSANRAAESSNASINDPTDMRSSYAATKRVIESLVLSAKYPAVVGRFFNVSGPHQCATKGVLPKLMKEGIETGSISIHKPGSQTRSFSHIKDICKYIVFTLTSPGCHNEVFNMGSSGNEVSMLEISERIREYFYLKGTVLEVHMCDSQLPDVILERSPDMTKLKSVFTEYSSTDLYTILDDVYNHQLKKISNEETT